MKITTNNIGNYAINKINAKVQEKNIAQEQPIDARISNKEKDFFTELYPSKRDEIINYHFYSRSGEMSGVAVGKNLDRRM